MIIIVEQGDCKRKEEHEYVTNHEDHRHIIPEERSDDQIPHYL